MAKITGLAVRDSGGKLRRARRQAVHPQLEYELGAPQVKCLTDEQKAAISECTSAADLDVAET